MKRGVRPMVLARRCRRFNSFRADSAGPDDFREQARLRLHDRLVVGRLLRYRLAPSSWKRALKGMRVKISGFTDSMGFFQVATAHDGRCNWFNLELTGLSGARRMRNTQCTTR